MARLKQGGFTLIELMITVAVVAILAAVALPTYQNAMVKNRRATAQTFLQDVAQRQQQFLMDNRAYAATLDALRVPAPADFTRYYDLTITAAASTPPSYTLTAAPLSGGPQHTDGALSITHNGTKLPAGKW